MFVKRSDTKVIRTKQLCCKCIPSSILLDTIYLFLKTRKELTHGSRNDANQWIIFPGEWRIIATLALHCERLPSACLTIAVTTHIHTHNNKPSVNAKGCKAIVFIYRMGKLFNVIAMVCHLPVTYNLELQCWFWLFSKLCKRVIKEFLQKAAWPSCHPSHRKWIHSTWPLLIMLPSAHESQPQTTFRFIQPFCIYHCQGSQGKQLPKFALSLGDLHPI